LPQGFVDDDGGECFAQRFLLVEQCIGGDDPNLHVLAVAQLALEAALFEAAATVLLVFAAGPADVGVALLR
jgi:hypothetical protein